MLNPLMEAPEGSGTHGPVISVFPLQQVGLRAFNKSSNKINFYSKCIGSISSLVPRVPSTSPGSIH